MDTTPHLYQQIAESVRRRVAAGELAPGDRLPPVREMARQWSCTPGTVSRAYAALAEEGLVVAHRGSGTRVAAAPPPADRSFWAWAHLVHRAEAFLLAAVGGGHTPAAAQSALAVAVSRWQALSQLPPPPPAGGGAGLRLAGSHDLSLELLVRHLAAAGVAPLPELRFVGSLGGLMALARGEADVAGIHLWDAVTDVYNAPFVHRLLPGQRVALVTLARRALGLILPPHNPDQVRSLADAARPQVRWVNRQPGSGTRVWLDAQLAARGIDTRGIPGYGRAEATHLAVARAVADGEARVGPGIHAAAAAHGLDFVPLTQEPFQLVVPAAVWETAAWQRVLAVIRSDDFRAAVLALGGYDTTATGEVSWLAPPAGPVDEEAA